MKLAELGLKTKPQTKYFAGGWVSFSTQNKELSYSIVGWFTDALDASVQTHSEIEHGSVDSKDKLEFLLSIKTLTEVIQRLKQ